jgi:hypothetical protein
MEIKLSDFTIDQLAFAVVAIKEAQEMAIHAIAQHEVQGTNPEHPSIKFWNNQAEMSVTWLAHLKYAISVKHQETTVTSN